MWQRIGIENNIQRFSKIMTPLLMSCGTIWRRAFLADFHCKVDDHKMKYGKLHHHLLSLKLYPFHHLPLFLHSSLISKSSFFTPLSPPPSHVDPWVGVATSQHPPIRQFDAVVSARCNKKNWTTVFLQFPVSSSKSYLCHLVFHLLEFTTTTTLLTKICWVNFKPKI